MLIPGLTLTPGLAERLRACGDSLDIRIYRDADVSWELAHDVAAGPRRDGVAKERQWQIQQVCYAAGWPENAPDATSILVLHLDGSELSEHEQTRVDGVIAAHRVEAF